MVCAVNAITPRDEKHLTVIRRNIWAIIHAATEGYRESGPGILLMFETDFIDKMDQPGRIPLQTPFCAKGTEPLECIMHWIEEQDLKWAMDYDPDKAMILVINHAKVGLSLYRIEFAAAVTDWIEAGL